METLETFADFESFLASFTNYERKRRYPYSRDAFPPERMRGFVSELGDPQHGYRAVHVAGTKGKGSTALMLEALLEAEGYRVGTYTSPHVEHLRERIRVCGRWISEVDVVRLANSLLPVLERRRREDPQSFPTFFELMTALAMAHFASEKVDWAIFEVGLGGRLDATNILLPLVTAITSIGLEHTAVLGHTLKEIAREKAGVIKERTPVVVGEVPGEALDEILAEARRQNAEVILSRAEDVRPAGPGCLAIDGHAAPLAARAVRGPALRANLSVALVLERLALQQDRRRPSPERLAAALASLRLPARVEYFDGAPPVLLDGAHTADSFTALRETLKEIAFPRPRTVVFSLASDKWAEPILRDLPGLGEDFIFTRADPLRSLSPEDIRDRVGFGDVVEEPRKAFAEALGRGRPVLVCGSMYLAGEVRGMVR